ALADARVAEPAAAVSQRRRPAGVEAGAEAVARGEVQIALGIHAVPAAAFPDAGGAAVGGGVEDLLQRQVTGPVADHPAVVRAVVPVGGPGDVDDAIDQGQGGTLVFAQGVEAQGRPVTAGARAGDRDGGRVCVAPVWAADRGIAEGHHAVGSSVLAGGDV